jgi:hypothetical protein
MKTVNGRPITMPEAILKLGFIGAVPGFLFGGIIGAFLGAGILLGVLLFFRAMLESNGTKL